jgi:hypothetical protein
VAGEVVGPDLAQLGALTALVWSVIWLAAGVVAYLGWTRYHRTWPFGPKEIHEAFVPAEARSLSSGGRRETHLDVETALRAGGRGDTGSVGARDRADDGQAQAVAVGAADSRVAEALERPG